MPDDHGAQIRERGLPWPRFQGDEVRDLVEYSRAIPILMAGKQVPRWAGLMLILLYVVFAAGGCPECSRRSQTVFK